MTEDLLRRIRVDRAGDMTAAGFQNEADKREEEGPGRTRGRELLFSSVLNDPLSAGIRTFLDRPETRQRSQQIKRPRLAVRCPAAACDAPPLVRADAAFLTASTTIAASRTRLDVCSCPPLHNELALTVCRLLSGSWSSSKVIRRFGPIRAFPLCPDWEVSLYLPSPAHRRTENVFANVACTFSDMLSWEKTPPKRIQASRPSVSK